MHFAAPILGGARRRAPGNGAQWSSEGEPGAGKQPVRFGKREGETGAEAVQLNAVKTRDGNRRMLGARCARRTLPGREWLG